jgi:5-methylcytosine-specific restriction endonuclease McrA
MRIGFVGKCNCGANKILCKSMCSKCYNKNRYHLNIEKSRQQKQKSDNKYRDKRTEYARKYRKENKDVIAATAKKYRENNKKNIKNYSSTYYKKNKERIKIYQKEYWSTHKEIRREKERRRRANKNSICELFSKDEWVNKKQKTDGMCPVCSRHVGIDNLELDHIIPISRASINQMYFINDIQPLCRPCNSQKNNKMEIDNHVKYIIC